MFDSPIFGLIAIAVAAVALAAILPWRGRDSVRRTLSILTFRGLNKATSAIERETALVEEHEGKILDAQHKLSDLEGTLQSQRNELGRLESDLGEAEATYELATNRNADAAVVNRALDNVASAQQLVDAQKGVIEATTAAVDETRAGVKAAQEALRQAQLTLKTDAAKAKAAGAIQTAAAVLESTKGLSSIGSQIKKESSAIDEQFEQARARMGNAKGSKEDQALADLSADARREQIRARLEAKRTGGGTPPTS